MSAPSGAVYDRGYRPYDGSRGGRGAARLALFRASIRRALGLRRSWRQKVAPFLLLGIVTIPAIVNVGIAYLTRGSAEVPVQLITYREYVGVSTALLLFVALTAPDVICPDRRQRVLPLIFARPLTGADYVMAKVGAIFAIVFAFSYLPQVVLYVGQALVSDAALDYVRGHGDVLWKSPLACAVLAAFYAVIGVAVASTTTRRVIAGTTFLGLFLVTSTVSGIASAAAGGERTLGIALLNILALPIYLRDVVFLGSVDPASGLGGVEGAGVAVAAAYVVLLAAALAFLLRRYRWSER